MAPMPCAGICLSPRPRGLPVASPWKEYRSRYVAFSLPSGTLTPFSPSTPTSIGLTPSRPRAWNIVRNSIAGSAPSFIASSSRWTGCFSTTMPPEQQEGFRNLWRSFPTGISGAAVAGSGRAKMMKISWRPMLHFTSAWSPFQNYWLRLPHSWPRSFTRIWCARFILRPRRAFTSVISPPRTAHELMRSWLRT